MATVYISHAFSDGAFVDDLAKLLADRGHYVTYPHKILPGNKYQEELAKQLKQTDVLLAVLSKDSVNNPNVWGEFGAAVGYNEQLGRPLLFVLQIDSVPIPSHLNDRAIIQAPREGFDEWGSRIMASIERSVASVQAERTRQQSEALRTVVSHVAAHAVASNPILSISGALFPALTIFSRSEKSTKTIEDQISKRLKGIADLDIDPVTFDSLLSNELDRRLKLKFGITFLVLTILFTATSFAVVICDSIYSWDIPETAIAALVIEVPIQFVGLLYIIARNLFPNKSP